MILLDDAVLTETAAFADASLHTTDAAWAAIVYHQNKVVRAAWDAGTCRTIGEAETRAVFLAKRLLDELILSGTVYTDSQEAARAFPDNSVTWIPREQNKAADFLSKIGRTTWQKIPTLIQIPTQDRLWTPTQAALPKPELIDTSPTMATPKNLEHAVLELIKNGGISGADILGHIQQSWPKLLQKRRDPRLSVLGATEVLLRSGKVRFESDTGNIVRSQGIAGDPEILAFRQLNGMPITNKLSREMSQEKRFSKDPVPLKKAVEAWICTEDAILILEVALAEYLEEMPSARTILLSPATVARVLRNGGVHASVLILVQNETTVALLRNLTANPQSIIAMLDMLGFSEIPKPKRPAKAWDWLRRRLITSIGSDPDIEVQTIPRWGDRKKAPFLLAARHPDLANTLNFEAKTKRQSALSLRQELEDALITPEGHTRKELGLTSTVSSLKGTLAERLVGLKETQDVLLLNEHLRTLAEDSGALEAVVIAGRRYITAESVYKCKINRYLLLKSLGTELFSTLQAAAVLGIAPIYVHKVLGYKNPRIPYWDMIYSRKEVEAAKRQLYESNPNEPRREGIT